MKKFTFFVIYLFLLIFTFLPFTLGHYGDGDCQGYHELKILNVPYISSAEMTLDGIPSESSWKSLQNNSGRYQIRLSTNINEPNFQIITLNISFLRDQNSLYILCEWPDITTRPLTRDGIYFCWNIDVPNFSAYYPGGMDTSHMGGGYVDSWLWNINSESSLNRSNNFCLDRSFGPTGYTTENDLTTVGIGYTTNINKSYCVELCRDLTTNDKKFDFQIQESILYKFNLGIINDSSHGEEHAISYTHALDFGFENNQISAYFIFPFILTVFITANIIFLKRNNKKLID